MDPGCLVSMIQAGGHVMMSGIVSWDTLDLLVPTEHCSNVTAYVLVVVVV